MKEYSKNIVIGNDVKIGKNVYLGHNCVIEDNVCIGDDVFIDNNTIIRSNACVNDRCLIGSNCIIGEYAVNTRELNTDEKQVTIGKDAIIRSGTIIYSGSVIGDHFQTGHHVTIREGTEIGNNVSIGTISDIQGNCRIGNYVRLHSNVHIGQLSIIDDFVWIYPYSVLTNDPTPPSDVFRGVHVCSFAVICTSAVILPGLEIGQDSLVGAGAIVTKSVLPYSVALGNPARAVGDVRDIKSKCTGKSIYPWRKHFKKYMPWEKEEFDKWYEQLSSSEKSKYRINE